MTITTGAIISTSTTTDESSPIYESEIQGNQIDNYQSSYPIYNPAGFFSIPMPNAQALFTQSPYAGTGYIQGFFNESPTKTNVADLIDGEVAICETAGYNFNIKAKVDALISTFTNSNNNTIDGQIIIGQNVVTALIDVFQEIVAFETYIATHTHSGVQIGSDTSGNPTTPYTPTSNFTRDELFLNQSPSKMFINVNGELIS